MNKSLTVIRIKKIIWIIILFIFWTVASPANALISSDQALSLAQNFIGHMGSLKTIQKSIPFKNNALAPKDPEIVCGWIMNLTGGGYILVPSSDEVYPIKAYSLETGFDQLPPAFRTYLEKELELYARKSNTSGTSSRTAAGMTQAQTARSYLLNWTGYNRQAQTYTPPEILLTTRWNQGFPYNKFLPEIDGQNVLTGCVNTALAQVMKYHGYPATGKGIASYSWNGYTLSSILSHPYHWAYMQDIPGMTDEGYTQDEIGILFRDLGIINETQFGLNASSAYLHQDALVTHFGYSNTMASMNNLDANAFFAMLKSQIDQRLPVLLSLPGHMVVVDGYNVDATGRNFHLNMGWGGSQNNYYYLDQQVVAEPYTFSTENLSIVYNVKPCTGSDCTAPEPVLGQIAPVLNLPDEEMIMATENGAPKRLRVDVRDGNGDDITYGLTLSNSTTVNADLKDSLLTITPLTGSAGRAVTVRITATAGGDTIHKDLTIIVTDTEIAYGAETELSGRFESVDGAYQHRVILEGACTLKGDRGYSNQAFFTGLKNSQGQVIIATTSDLTTVEMPASLPLDVYTVTASLKSESSYFTYSPGDHDWYIIKATMPKSLVTASKAASALNIDLSGTQFYVKGDMNGDRQVNVEDKIIQMRLLTTGSDLQEADPSHDTSGDGRVGIEDLVYWP